ncbi:MAG: V-type ATPase subunit [Actinobacteria bacterium]|nr:V-type ATPase subunit [Actinomycetota bacterium]
MPMVQVPIKDYSYANARVRAMTSRLLAPSVFRELLAAPDYNRALGVLEETEYQEDLEHFMLEGARPTIVDRAFNRNLVRNFGKIKEFFTGKPLKLVNLLLSRWDLYNLKTILRGLRALVPKQEIQRILVPVGFLDEAVLQEIINQPDLRAALDAVVVFGMEWPIRYGRAISEHLVEYLREHDLSVLELALDRFHYRQVAGELRNRDPDTSLVREVVRLEVDAVNLVTLMRICGMELEASRADDFFVPGGSLEDPDEFARLMSLSRPENVYQALLRRFPEYRGPLQAAWKNFDERGEAAFEDELQKNLIRRCLSMSRDPLGIGVIINYMWRKYLEITNLRIIMRGKSIGLIESQIRKELFLWEEETAREGAARG